MIGSFSVDVFNNLVSDYHDVRHLGEDDKELPMMVPKINEFGDLFLKHKKEANVGLSLSHRHFKLFPGEKKVAEQNSDTLMTIKAMKEADIEELTKKGGKVLPYLFLPVSNDDGSVSALPLEYVVLFDDARIASVEKGIQQICDQAFLREFVALANKFKVNGVYGLFLPSRAEMKVKEDQSTLEGTGQGDRTLVVQVVDRETAATMRDDAITTVAWRFRKDPSNPGKVVPISACSSIQHGKAVGGGNGGGNTKCWAHCHHCYHC